MKKQKEDSHEGITWSEMENKMYKPKRSIGFPLGILSFCVEGDCLGKPANFRGASLCCVVENGGVQRSGLNGQSSRHHTIFLRWPTRDMLHRKIRTKQVP